MPIGAISMPVSVFSAHAKNAAKHILPGPLEADPLQKVGLAGQPEGAAQEKNWPPEVKECESCEKRVYQDESDDSGVSFQMPTKISADAAQQAVRGHEAQHVFRERNKARMEGREVISQSVSIHSRICAECGRAYVAGGTTRTVTKGKEAKALYDVGKSENSQGYQSQV